MPTATIYSAAKTGYPGPIDTRRNGKLGLEQEASEVRAVVALVPAGRLGQAVEVASAVVFLASDEARSIASGELIIDGGMGIV